ncbi:hypothetical protein KSF78_0001403 [Schistosoma japonicum]|nr:hypothetical protein KSF78_0001403 [Schistosoma japonicum]
MIILKLTTLYKLYIIVLSIVHLINTTDLERCMKMGTLMNNTRTTVSIFSLQLLELQDCLATCCLNDKCLGINYNTKAKTHKEPNCGLVHSRDTICFENKEGWNHYLVRKYNRSINVLRVTPKNKHICQGRLHITYFMNYEYI